MIAEWFYCLGLEFIKQDSNVWFNAKKTSETIGNQMSLVLIYENHFLFFSISSVSEAIINSSSVGMTATFTTESSVLSFTAIPCETAFTS